MQFRDFDVETFLRDYWQKKPLLIRNPWVNWENPLQPDELAGLACEDGVEARMLVQGGGTGDGDEGRGWNVAHGPLDEEKFSEFGTHPSTLLVQAVDHMVPAVAALIAPFRFIPDWRTDDVMVSCASDGGGVGAHFDQYDVFLIQGLGRRRWQIGAMCNSDTPLLPNDDFRLIKDFEPTEEWVLEAGDILYVPPGIPHNGVAVGDDCMTYSVGFRAPSRYELIANFCDEVLDDLPDEDRYTDPDLQRQDSPGEISGDAIRQLQAMVLEKMQDRETFARWFGEYNSTPKYPEIDWRPEEPVEMTDLRACLDQSVPLCRNPASRFAFYRQESGAILLFVDGESFECTDEAAKLAQLLCENQEFVADEALQTCEAAMELLLALFNQGSVAFELWE